MIRPDSTTKNFTHSFAYDPYDSFRNIIATSGNIVNNFRYTGREWDGETSLYYYRARYYDPNTGRFLSEDPISFRSDVNFYRYALNRPTTLADPSGLQTTVVIIYDYGFGSHSAVLVDNGGNPILFDPAGSYAPAHLCGTGDACHDLAADLKKYTKHHEDRGSTVRTFVFNTTPEEEAEIAQRIEDADAAAPGFCTLSVSNVLSGTGPFKNLKPNLLPGSLARQLDKLLPKPFGGGGGDGW